ncbi:MAG: cation transport regulator [Methyloprofundus sp.]|nr:cation transport regulator [Methyloprofundus sp.]
MPYKTISDLPKEQVKNYTAHQKKAFLKAFNNAYKQYDHEESKAFAVAHHAAQQASENS